MLDRRSATQPAKMPSGDPNYPVVGEQDKVRVTSRHQYRDRDMTPSLPNQESSIPVDKFDHEAAYCAPTRERKQALGTDRCIEKPGIGRANVAVTTAKPNGSETYSSENSDYVRTGHETLFKQHPLQSVVIPVGLLMMYVGHTHRRFSNNMSCSGTVIATGSYTPWTHSGAFGILASTCLCRCWRCSSSTATFRILRVCRTRYSPIPCFGFMWEACTRQR
jgi:hypothetical protein